MSWRTFVDTCPIAVATSFRNLRKRALARHAPGVFPCSHVRKHRDMPSLFTSCVSMVDLSVRGVRAADISSSVRGNDGGTFQTLVGKSSPSLGCALLSSVSALCWSGCADGTFHVHKLRYHFLCANPPRRQAPRAGRCRAGLGEVRKGLSRRLHVGDRVAAGGLSPGRHLGGGRLE